MSSPQPIPFPLRIPEELRKSLAERAHTHNRSLNAEILGILQDAISRKPGPVDGLNVDALADTIADRVAARLKETT